MKTHTQLKIRSLTMKFAILLAVLAAVCFVVLPSVEAECGKHEKYNNCGSPCPPTCKNPSPSCPPVCTAGCFCKPKYIRDDKGNCVKPAKCTGFFAKVKDMIG